MSLAADYSVVEHLRDGRAIEIRALRPDDRTGMLAAIGQTSSDSLRRRTTTTGSVGAQLRFTTVTDGSTPLASAPNVSARA